MSILASLVRAYARLAERKEVPPFGYENRDIHGCIVIDNNGIMIGPPVTWHKDDQGRASARLTTVPYYGGRSGTNADPYFLWDNTAYVLGISKKENFNALKRHNDFKCYHCAELDRTSDDGLRALLLFLQQWEPEQYYAAGFTDELKDRNFVFRLASEMTFIHERPAAKAAWASAYKPDVIGPGLCLVTGDRAEIARIHPPISSFENPARIVSFDKQNVAFSSYGNVQGGNAPTGIVSAFAYSAVLNRLLSRRSKQRIQIGDASTVFWADASNAEAAEAAEKMFAFLFQIDESIEAAKIADILAKIRAGAPVPEFQPALAPGVRFHILGLAPNAARLSVRFYIEDDFGVLAKRYAQHHERLRIDPLPRHGIPSMRRLLIETAVLGKPENIQPNLAGEWMRAILTGAPYPLSLLSSVIMRLRADHEVNALRVAILKSVLIRNFKVEAPVSLDPNFKDPGYVLGRLFAVYEQIQVAALGTGVNATIKDKFYGAASAQPRKVFHILDAGSANHLSKVGKQSPGRRINLEKAIAAIMDLMEPASDPYPACLPDKSQALFALGYYHQRNEFFRKAAEKSEAEEAA